MAHSDALHSALLFSLCSHLLCSLVALPVLPVWPSPHCRPLLSAGGDDDSDTVFAVDEEEEEEEVVVVASASDLADMPPLEVGEATEVRPNRWQFIWPAAGEWSSAVDQLQSQSDSDDEMEEAQTDVDE